MNRLTIVAALAGVIIAITWANQDALARERRLRARDNQDAERALDHVRETADGHRDVHNELRARHFALVGAYAALERLTEDVAAGLRTGDVVASDAARVLSHATE